MRIVRNVFAASLMVAWMCAGYWMIDGAAPKVGRYVDKALEFILWPGTARGADYAGASDSEWFTTLKQPDNTAQSCCGYADAYRADEVAPCGPKDGANCWLVAIITDTRPDTFQVDDGKGGVRTISRPHVPPGTRVPVSHNKRRPVASYNPTNHGIIFLATGAAYDDNGNVVEGPAWFSVYCYEPQSGI